jgi:homoserine O-acetyltransferase
VVKKLVLSTFELESGVVLRHVPVAYRTWGGLDDDGSNAVVVCHALTGDTNADRWWSGLIGPGCPIDTDRFFVVCANVLGSPYGTASPVSLNPHTDVPYGTDFPATTIRDTVALHRKLLDSLGVKSVAFVIGGSMGGMQVLEWAFQGDLVKRLVPIAVGARHSAWCIGWSEAQRQAIYADSNWNGGAYSAERPPAAGLAAARMMAMVSYRSPGEWRSRFDRRRSEESETSVFAVESYLRYQGEKLNARFDANCYVRLTQQMDTHDITRGRGPLGTVLGRITQPALVVGISSDVLYPLEEQRELAAGIPDADLLILDAPYGHDSFLVERESLGRHLAEWLSSGERAEPRIVGRTA